MPRPPIPTWFVALVVVRRGDRFLVVQERTHGQLWSLPGGRIEPGELPSEAACRETLEETGVPVILEGIVRFEHTRHDDGSARLRIVFLARPADESEPKSVADAESLRAAWVGLDELARLPLRSPEVRELFEQVAGGAPVCPLEVLVEADAAAAPRRKESAS